MFFWGWLCDDGEEATSAEEEKHFDLIYIALEIITCWALQGHINENS